MKASSAFLAVSLVANAALVAVYVARPAGAPQSAAAPAGRPVTAVSPNASERALRDALERGDAAALEAAGLSPEVARELALGRAFARIGEKVRATRAALAGDGRWWRRQGAGPSREQLLQLRRDVSDAMMAAFGEDLSTLDGSGGGLAFLPPEKRDALRRIAQDYDEMMARFGAGGIQLASDREKLRLLRAERERDIAALLTPEERLAYDLHNSPTAAMVRARYGEGIESEEDFRKIYELQKALDEKFPREGMTSATLKERTAAERQLQDDIRAALGDEKFAALRRATDGDLRNVESLVSRLGLPAATTDQVAAAREALAAESQRLINDPSLNPQQRRAGIQDLGARAKASVVQALGAEAGEAYAQRSPWISMLQGGVAYATTPPPGTPALGGIGQSVYPVMPAGAATPGAAKHVVMAGGTVTDAAVGGGDLFFAPANPTPVVRDSVQVMTFSTSDGAGVVQKKIMVPAQPATPPKP